MQTLITLAIFAAIVLFGALVNDRPRRKKDKR